MMKVTNTYLLFALVAIFFANPLFAVNIFFVGNGDGTSWEDPQNWNTGTIPTAADDVGIDGSFHVVINELGAVAQTLDLADNGKLTIAPNANLTVNEGKNDRDAVVIRDNGILTNNGGLDISNASNNCIDMTVNALFINNATFSTSLSDGDLVDMSNQARVVNNGFMQFSENEADGMDINNDCSVLNDGQMFFIDIENEGVNMDGSSSFINNGLYSVDGIDGNDGICVDDAGTTFENNGNIFITNVINGGEGIEVDDGVFTNNATGVIEVTEVTGDVFKVESGAEIFNHGTISLSGNDSNDVLEIDSGGTVTNFGSINITEVSNDTIFAINLEANSSLLNNQICGIINILSNNAINIEEEDGQIINDGVIGTVFGGVNINNGIFTNNGKIAAPNGFIIAPNALAGTGVLDFTGNVPAHGLCFTVGSIDCEGSTDQDPVAETATQVAIDCIYGPPYNSDVLTFALQDLCGDGSITARLANIQGLGWAGVTMRESTDAGSKKVQLTRNQTNKVRREVRTVDNAAAFPQTINAFNSTWLRITREGNVFSGYISRDGINFQFVLAATINMNECIKVGIITTNYTNPGTTTADFEDVFIAFGPIPSIADGSDTPAFGIEMPSSKGQAQVYPNPSNGQVTIGMDAELDTPVIINVMSALGQQLKSFQITPALQHQIELDLSDLPTGIYHLQFVQLNGEMTTEKLILQQN